DRFVARVAEGRGLPVDRVRDLGRGRIWSGTDALAHGLVDELGDLEAGIACARKMADLGPDAPVWDVEPPDQMLLPSAPDAAALLEAARPLLRETSWLLLPVSFRMG